MRSAILPLLTIVFGLSSLRRTLSTTTYSDDESYYDVNDLFLNPLDVFFEHDDPIWACFQLASRGSECVGALDVTVRVGIRKLNLMWDIKPIDFIPCVNFAKDIFDIIHNHMDMKGNDNICRKVIGAATKIPRHVAGCLGKFGIGPVAQMFSGDWLAIQLRNQVVYSVPGKLAAWIGCRTEEKSEKRILESQCLSPPIPTFHPVFQCFSPPTQKCNLRRTPTFGSAKGKLMFIVPVDIYQIKNIKIRAGDVIDGIGFELYRGSTEFFQTGYGNTNQYENFPFHDMKPDKIKVEWVRENDWYGSVITSLTFINTFITGERRTYGGNWKFDESLLETEYVDITCELGFLGHIAEKGLSFSIFTGPWNFDFAGEK